MRPEERVGILHFRVAAVAFAAGLALSSHQASAQEMMACRQIADNAARLRCYDAASSPSGGQPAAPNSSAFKDGLADRKAYETWFLSLSMGERAGAEFWAAERSLKHPRPCANQAPLWIAGCVEAQRRLGPSDVRRLSEPDYRTGWNSLPDNWVPNAPIVADNAPATAGKPPPSEPDPLPLSPQAPIPGPNAPNRSGLLGSSDIPRLQHEYDESPDRFANTYLGKAPFSGTGTFGGWSRSPLPQALWMASVALDGTRREYAYCFFDHEDTIVSNIAPGRRVRVLGMVALPLDDGLALTANCTIQIED